MKNINIIYQSDMRFIEKEKINKIITSDFNFLSNFNIVLQYLDKIAAIQIYSDNVIRLCLKSSYLIKPFSIFIRDSEKILVQDFYSKIIK